MTRRTLLLALFVLPSLFVLGRLRALMADEPSAAPADGSLLERLSAETATLAERGERASAHLVSEGEVWIGALVGEGGHFVLALDPTTVVAQLPRTAKLRRAGEPEAEATLLDADSDLGLAIYSTNLNQASRRSLLLARSEELARGRLAVVADAALPELTVLGPRAGPWEDVPAREAVSGVTLLAPGGALIGLAPSSSQANVATCTACHLGAGASLSSYSGKRFVSADGGQTWGVTPRLTFPRTGIGPHPGAPHLELLWTRLARDRAPDASAAGAPRVEAAGAFVPAPVIARALEDVAAGRRLGRAYLGVVPEGGAVVDAWGNPLAYFTNYDVLSTTSGRSLRFQVQPGLEAVRGSARLRFAQVIADSPAAAAGLRAGQEVVAVDDVDVRSAGHFARMLARRRPGETVRLAVQGLAEPVSVVLGDRDKEGRTLATALSVGLEVQPLTAELSAFLNVTPGEGGVVVRAVTAESAAAQAGLQRGDVIRDGGGGPIRDLAELDAVLGAAQDEVLLGVERDGQRFALTLRLPKAAAGRRTR